MSRKLDSIPGNTGLIPGIPSGPLSPLTSTKINTLTRYSPRILYQKDWLSVEDGPNRESTQDVFGNENEKYYKLQHIIIINPLSVEDKHGL